MTLPILPAVGNLPFRIKGMALREVWAILLFPEHTAQLLAVQGLLTTLWPALATPAVVLWAMLYARLAEPPP